MLLNKEKEDMHVFITIQWSETVSWSRHAKMITLFALFFVAILDVNKHMKMKLTSTVLTDYPS